MSGSAITVVKLDDTGQEKLRYEGRVLARGATWIKLEAIFTFDTSPIAAGIAFQRGDRSLEWFYTDRMYNIFEVYAAADDHLKAWYCNVTRPAVLTADTVAAEDLALDLLIEPDGTLHVLDEDEFEVLTLSAEERQAALAVVDTLRRAVHDRTPPFDDIQAR